MTFPLKLPTAVIGLGLSGRSIQNLLLKLNIPPAQVLLFDEKDPSAQFSQATDLLMQNPQSLILSPGVPKQQKWIQDFIHKGGQVTSELEIAFSFLNKERVIAVTGSVGKSTCTSLLSAGLSRFSPHAFVGGNLGFPLADYVSQVLSGRLRAEWIVLELSSFQLETFSNLRADASLITSLTANHLERYKDLEHYYETKWSLLEKTHGPVVLADPGGDLFSFAKKKKHKGIWSSSKQKRFLEFPFHQAKIIGQHNYENLAAVITLAEALSWPSQALEGFLEFPGLPHRLENLGVIRGIHFINDSKATAIESVLQACQMLDSLLEKKTSASRQWILLGGRDKNLPWEKLATLNSSPSAKQRKFLFFGESASALESRSNLTGKSYHSLKSALNELFLQLKPSDIVLLSPGGTSLDEFQSFEDRGSYFKNQVLKYSQLPNQLE